MAHPGATDFGTSRSKDWASKAYVMSKGTDEVTCMSSAGGNKACTTKKTLVPIDLCVSTMHGKGAYNTGSWSEWNNGKASMFNTDASTRVQPYSYKYYYQGTSTMVK